MTDEKTGRDAAHVRPAEVLIDEITTLPLAPASSKSKITNAAPHRKERDLPRSPRSGRASFQQAKSPSPKCPVFTNCGKAEQREKPVKPAQKKLKRVPFTVSRLMEFCTRRELVNVTGHDVSDWPLVVLKEVIDNAMDACEEAEVAPSISIAVQGTVMVIEDNGPGIPAKTIKRILDYSKRTSSREAYVSPSRGQQGNALSSILPMSYVLDAHHGEEASGKTIIESHGLAHYITFDVDHVKQEPKITHTTEPSPVVQHRGHEHERGPLHRRRNWPHAHAALGHCRRRVNIERSNELTS